MNDALRVLESCLSPYENEIVSFQAGTPVHHVGLFDPRRDRTDRPIWVSHDSAVAMRYAAAPLDGLLYTQFVLIRDVALMNYGHRSTLDIYVKLGARSHGEWNRHLAFYLRGVGLDGFIYLDSDVLLADPSQVVRVTNFSRL